MRVDKKNCPGRFCQAKSAELKGHGIKQSGIRKRCIRPTQKKIGAAIVRTELHPNLFGLRIASMGWSTP
jgi:hypothetical protein